LVLERADGTLRKLLKEFSKNSPNSQHPSALQWSLGICNGFAFLHKHGVIHGDIGCQNILISADGRAKLCDFAGSKIGDKAAWVAYEIRSQHPTYSGQQPKIETELFAIGSLLYEIFTLSRPYASLDDGEVQRKFSAGEFPLDSVEKGNIAEIIRKCWKGDYDNVPILCEDLEHTRISI
jgi:serine/threonine protein kinase